MAQSNGLNPNLDALTVTPQVITAVAVPTYLTREKIQAGKTAVVVSGTTVDANDWITLPPLASVPTGHTITIQCAAGSNFEMRTPASSNEKINNVDADGTQEYLCTDTNVIIVRKMGNTEGWMAQGFTRLGAVVAAVVPD